MERSSRPVTPLSSSADLAFAVVVLASYFATFSVIQDATLLEIGIIALLGIIYILWGIYGYAFSSRSNVLAIRILYFAIQIPIGSAIVYLTRGAGFNALVMLPLAAHAVILLPERWGYLTNAVSACAYTIAVLVYSGSWVTVWSVLPTFFAGLIFVIIFTQTAVEEEKARKEVERLAGELEELTVTRERNRLAREIHDGLGHYLTTIYMQIQAAGAVMKSDPDKAQRSLSKASELTQEALTDVRQSVAALRTAPEQTQPLPSTIAKLLSHCDGTPLHPELQVLGTPRPLSPTAHLTLYRAAQEGINNACKHSEATRLLVTLDYQNPGEVMLRLHDNGIGSEDPIGGFGLPGLQERVNLLRGRFNVQSSKGEGFTMEVGVPG
ncbi:MAG TPA: sensor histidine kinase [Anaerolineaceae bacterium]|jgi:signal transduction histidine kinase|nr:sensor histidine kinase [Anaerolineaceae bacterium]